jgi:phage N-6-adenine-methyltransferase
MNRCCPITNMAAACVPRLRGDEPEAAEPISTASVARTAHAIEGLSDDARASLIEQGENQLLEVANRIKEEHNHRAQGTGENEWYTPSEHLDAARRVLGTIDLDPASSEVANRTVDAVQYFTLADDGLAKPWRGAVWMNPPYAQPWIMRFAQKLRASVESGDVTQAVALTHNYTDTAWFHLLAERADAICFTRGRISFLSPEGKKAAPTQGQAFFYFGANRSAFVEQFAQFGMIMMRHVI